MSRSGYFQVENLTRGTILATRSKRANNVVTRAFGLMGRRSLPDAGALIIRPCSSVTTAFMRFHIDVLFVDRDNVIREIIPAMRPWRISRFVRGSKFVVELPTGVVHSTQTQLGDTLDIKASAEGE